MHMVATAAAIDDRPCAFRYPRGEGIGVELPEEGVPLEIGKGRILREGSAVALLSLGTRACRVPEGGRSARRLRPVGDGCGCALRQAARRGSDPPARRRTTRCWSRSRKARSAASAATCCSSSPRAGCSIAASRCAPWCCPTSSSSTDKPERMYELAGLSARRHRRDGARRARPRDAHRARRAAPRSASPSRRSDGASGSGYSTVMVITSDCTGGSCGMWFLSREHVLQRVLAGRELDLRLGLRLAVVDVVGVGRDRARCSPRAWCRSAGGGARCWACRCRPARPPCLRRRI